MLRSLVLGQIEPDEAVSELGRTPSGGIRTPTYTKILRHKICPVYKNFSDKDVTETNGMDNQ